MRDGIEKSSSPPSIDSGERGQFTSGRYRALLANEELPNPSLAILPMSRTISNSYKKIACTTVVITIEDAELIAPAATMESGVNAHFPSIDVLDLKELRFR